MENIFVVTKGEYSDYHICGVFSTKKKAKLFIASIKSHEIDDYQIEKYTLNPYDIELSNGYKLYFVRMAKDGNVIEVKLGESDYSIDIVSFDVRKNIYMYCYAKDEQHAIKILNEKRGQKIALNQWPV
ncbi:hypothetical protein [Massilibacteroides sp.]|uniref:DUF7336 domain-containing protein n=1 Tax=Massilibacteroides sp. TaxID=2034766 RepID=UPI0026052718|nr:hypothetical protein [Massilibacteroides sp.]MDD4515668.1 hypothetical protein [Massilibacteroides sp.]